MDPACYDLPGCTSNTSEHYILPSGITHGTDTNNIFCIAHAGFTPSCLDTRHLINYDPTNKIPKESCSRWERAQLFNKRLFGYKTNSLPGGGVLVRRASSHRALWSRQQNSTNKLLSIWDEPKLSIRYFSLHRKQRLVVCLFRTTHARTTLFDKRLL